MAVIDAKSAQAISDWGSHIALGTEKCFCIIACSQGNPPFDEFIQCAECKAQGDNYNI